MLEADPHRDSWAITVVMANGIAVCRIDDLSIHWIHSRSVVHMHGTVNVVPIRVVTITITGNWCPIDRMVTVMVMHAIMGSDNPATMSG
jgi:hypothetical protein